MLPEDVIDEVKTRLVEKFHPRCIIVFGSQARETADEHSDVDLLVVCPIQGSRRALMVAMDRALKGLPVARDILVLTPEEFERTNLGDVVSWVAKHLTAPRKSDRVSSCLVKPG